MGVNASMPPTRTGGGCSTGVLVGLRVRITGGLRTTNLITPTSSDDEDDEERVGGKGEVIRMEVRGKGEEGTVGDVRYILHAEWLAEVCGVSRRRPRQEELLDWSKSFDNLMNSKAGRRVFHEYLKVEYSQDNMAFWLACEDLKKEKNSTNIREKTKQIFDDFITVQSPREVKHTVSFDSMARDLINKNITNPTTNIFDEAQRQIYLLMQRDSYPRFLNSNNYLQLREQ